jgi:hypothetical protein
MGKIPRQQKKLDFKTVKVDDSDLFNNSDSQTVGTKGETYEYP